MGKKKGNSDDRVSLTPEGAALLELCQCGHTRGAHHYGFQSCCRCTDQELRQPGEQFACKPGLCDRFTWKSS